MDSRKTTLCVIRQHRVAYGITCVCVYAGGASKAGLKSAKQMKKERKAKKEEEAPAGGDLLGDLTAALGRRRTAMSGRNKDKREERKDKEEHSLGGGSMMDNISKMIPVTGKLQTEGSGEEGEGGW